MCVGVCVGGGAFGGDWLSPTFGLCFRNGLSAHNFTFCARCSDSAVGSREVVYRKC